MTHKNITLNKFKVRIKSFESFSFVFTAILKSAGNYISKVNKNTLTGPANCKKTTRLHAHLPLCIKSRKTNDAKSRKWPKTSIWAIFWRFRGQISPNCKFFWKIGSFKLKVIFSTNFRPKTKKIVKAVFEKKYQCLILGWFGGFFANISRSRFFFKNPAL